MRKNVLLVIGLLLVAFAIFVYALLIDKRAKLAELRDEEDGQICIFAESRDRFEEWSMGIYWRRDEGPWLGYLLDRQVPLWKNVELKKQSNKTVIVTLEGKNVAILNTRDGSFVNILRQQRENHPEVIISSSDPFNRDAYIYPESPGWDPMWPDSKQD